MAHEIHNFDGCVTVRKPAWHGLGINLPDRERLTAQEAIEYAKLGWLVEKAPVLFGASDGKTYPFQDKFATIRMPMDGEVGMDGTPLLAPIPLGVVSDEYSILQNSDAFRFMDRICLDPNGPKYVTAGSLWNGRKVWMLVSLPNFIEVAPGRDVIREYLLLSNTHDGSKRLEVIWTPVRVVCQNTLTLAQRTADKSTRVRFKHSSNLTNRINEAQDILGIIRPAHDELLADVRIMQNHEPTKEEIDAALNKLFPLTEGSKSSTRNDNVKTEINRLFRSGSANIAAGDTTSTFALYNGMTEYIQYSRGASSTKEDSDSRRLDSIWYGGGADLSAKAFDTCLELASKG